MPSVHAGPAQVPAGTATLEGSRPGPWVAALVAALVLLCGLAAPQSSAAGGPRIIDDLRPPLPGTGSQRLLIPAYFYPGDTPEPGETLSGRQKWHAMCDALDQRRSIIVLNQDNGRFTKGDEPYKDVLRYCLDRGRTVIGYVHTRQSPTDGHNLRPLAAVKADIDAHFREFPGIGGMFVDEMSNDPGRRVCRHFWCFMSHGAYYRAIYEHVHAKSSTARVVGNPGAAAATSWQVRDTGGHRPAADILVNFEGLSSTYAGWNPPSWIEEEGWAAERFAHLVYGSPSAAATTAACKASVQKRAGSVFVTRSTDWRLPPDAAMLSCPSLYRPPPVIAP